MIYTCWCCQFRLFHELGGIALPGTLCPLLVTLVAWQRASPRRTPRAAIPVPGSITSGFSQLFIHAARQATPMMDNGDCRPKLQAGPRDICGKAA